jgi:hypothetical protein
MRRTVVIAALVAAAGAGIAWCPGAASRDHHASRWVSESAGKLTSTSTRRHRFPGTAEVVARNPTPSAQRVAIELRQGCDADYLSFTITDQDDTPIPVGNPCEPVHATLPAHGFVRIELAGYNISYRVVVTGE